MERLGRRRVQYPVPVRRAGRNERRSGRRPQGEMGVRPADGLPDLAADRGRRPGVHRDDEGPGVFYRRRVGLPALVGTHDGRRAFDDGRRYAAGHRPAALRRVRRRRRGESVRPGRRHRQTNLEGQDRRSPAGADHGHAQDARQPHLRLGDRAGGTRRRRSVVRMLYVPRFDRGPEPLQRQTDLACVHDSRPAGAGPQERRRRTTLGAVGRRGLVVADARPGTQPRLRGHGRQLFRPAVVDERRDRSVRHAHRRLSMGQTVHCG